MIIRRLFRQFGTVAVVSWAWKHRGTVLRTADLARRAPQEIGEGRFPDVVTEAKTVLALDGELGDATDLRISQVSDGSVSFRAGVHPRTLDVARTAVLPISTVLDVHTDGTDQ